MDPPLVLDIDGTLTRASPRGYPPEIDPRLLDPLRDWGAPVVLATGKSFPYPVALCQFIGRATLVVAETGGIAIVGDHVRRFVAPTTFDEIKRALVDREWLQRDGFDDTNYWRETELALPRELPLDALVELATAHGMSVVDSGYAYHVKDPSISKGAGVEWIAGELGRSVEEFVAIGDSTNDVSTFERVGRSYALANGDEAARAAADVVVEDAHADGTLAVLAEIRDG